MSLTRPRQRRPVLIVAGLLMVALAGLAGALVVDSLSTTVPVVAAGVDLDPGHVVTAADLRVVEISNPAGASVVPVGDQDEIVGRVARGPIPAGAILHPDLFTDSAVVVPEGMSVVGAALEPGAAPVPGLRAGDRVDVMAVSAAPLSLDRQAPSGPVVLASGSVWAVERPSSGLGQTVVVSLLVPTDAQTSVAQAAAEGRLRLALRAGG